MVGQRRRRNVQKRVMHVQSFSFAVFNRSAYGAEGLKKNLNLGGTPGHQERRESPVAQQLKHWTCNPEAPP